MLKRHEEVRQRILWLKTVGTEKRRRMELPEGYRDQFQYSTNANRAQTDSIVALCTMLQEFLNDLRDLPDKQRSRFQSMLKKF